MQLCGCEVVLGEVLEVEESGAVGDRHEVTFFVVIDLKYSVPVVGYNRPSL